MAKSRTRAKAKYNKKAYDTILLYLPAGQKETLRVKAEALGKSVNSLLNGYVASLLCDTDISTVVDTNISISNDTDISAKNDTDISIKNDTDISIKNDTDISIKNDTDISTIINTDISTKKRKRMPSPTVEMIAQWRAMREQGKSYKEIAVAFGYTSEAVRNRLQS